MTDQAQTRRLQDTLTIAGSGVIAFSVWSLAKICLFLTFVDEKALNQLFELIGIGGTSLAITVYIILGVIILIDLGFRAYVGLSARAEGHGIKKSPFYLVVAAIAAIANVSSLFAIDLTASLEMSFLSMAVSVVIEITAFAALVLVIYCSLRLRRMGKAAR